MMERFNPENPYIALPGGRVVHLLMISPYEFTIYDIASALSKLCRFTGQVTNFYSVAQHSCYVHDLVTSNNRLWGLLHDASEAFIGDVSSPLKHLLPEYCGIEAKIMRCITDKYGLEPKIPDEVKTVDLRLLLNEAQALLPGVDIANWGVPAEPLDLKITGVWLPDVAEKEFLLRFSKLV